MLLNIDRHNGVPAYRQIMDQIKFQIASGLLQPGAELPSTRTLAASLALNPMTVSKAYSLLEHEGVVEHQPGLPLTVRQTDRKAQRATVAAQLRRILEPAAVQLAQLGVPTADAVEMLRKMLSDKRGNGDG